MALVTTMSRPGVTEGVVPAGHPLEAVFCPKSVAVLGVTPTPDTVPYDIFHNILTSGFLGTVYPVAPGKRSICAVRAYRYVLDIEDEVDQAVIVFPASVVDRALEQCGQKGVKSAIVISAGFREVGPKGIEREQRLKEICARYGIAMIGPNCLGVINTDPKVQLNASFARKMPAAGRIAFLSQSGALCTAVLDYAREKQIGFSKFVSFGNKAGVTEIELFDYLHQDPQTDVILLYLEELRDGRGLIEAARRVTRGPYAKPILAIKSGRTPQGADAAASHTGSLAGEDAVCDAVFREAGIIRVGSIEELFNAATLYAYQPLPAGNRLAIVTNAGGPGVMATDAAVRSGLSVPRLAPETMERTARSPARHGQPQEPRGCHRRRPRRSLHGRPGSRAGRPEYRPDARHSDAAVDDRHRGHRPRHLQVPRDGHEAHRLLVHGGGRRGPRHPAVAASPNPPLHPARVGLRGHGLRAADPPVARAADDRASSVCRSIARRPARSSKTPRRAISTRIRPWPCWRPTA